MILFSRWCGDLVISPENHHENCGWGWLRRFYLRTIRYFRDGVKENQEPASQSRKEYMLCLSTSCSLTDTTVTTTAGKGVNPALSLLVSKCGVVNCTSNHTNIDIPTMHSTQASVWPAWFVIYGWCTAAGRTHHAHATALNRQTGFAAANCFIESCSSVFTTKAESDNWHGLLYTPFNHPVNFK